MKLPSTVQEIADVIGRERALFLIGQLPRYHVQDTRKGKAGSAGLSERVILYVPKTLKPDHHLVRILGWNDAARLVRVFGGCLVHSSNCQEVYRPHRDAGIRLVHAQGVPVAMVADWFGLTERRARQILEIPHEGMRQAANDNARTSNTKRARK